MDKRAGRKFHQVWQWENGHDVLNKSSWQDDDREVFRNLEVTGNIAFPLEEQLQEGRLSFSKVLPLFMLHVFIDGILKRTGGFSVVPNDAHVL